MCAEWKSDPMTCSWPSLKMWTQKVFSSNNMDSCCLGPTNLRGKISQRQQNYNNSLWQALSRAPGMPLTISCDFHDIPGASDTWIRMAMALLLIAFPLFSSMVHSADFCQQLIPLTYFLSFTWFHDSLYVGLFPLFMTVTQLKLVETNLGIYRTVYGEHVWADKSLDIAGSRGPQMPLGLSLSPSSHSPSKGSHEWQLTAPRPYLIGFICLRERSIFLLAPTKTSCWDFHRSGLYQMSILLWLFFWSIFFLTGSKKWLLLQKVDLAPLTHPEWACLQEKEVLGTEGEQGGVGEGRHVSTTMLLWWQPLLLLKLNEVIIPGTKIKGKKISPHKWCFLLPTVDVREKCLETWQV